MAEAESSQHTSLAELSWWGGCWFEASISFAHSHPGRRGGGDGWWEKVEGGERERANETRHDSVVLSRCLDNEYADYSRRPLGEIDQGRECG